MPSTAWSFRERMILKGRPPGEAPAGALFMPLGGRFRQVGDGLLMSATYDQTRRHRTSIRAHGTGRRPSAGRPAPPPGPPAREPSAGAVAAAAGLGACDPSAHDCRGAPHARGKRDGAGDTVERAGAALHARAAVHEYGLLAFQRKDSVRTDICAKAAAVAAFCIELKRNGVFYVTKSSHRLTSRPWPAVRRRRPPPRRLPERAGRGASPAALRTGMCRASSP